MHLEPTNSSIARKRNHTLPFFNRYTTEKAISERLGLAIASPVRAHYFEFAGEHLALEENRGHFLKSWRHQLSNDAYQFGHFFSIVASIVCVIRIVLGLVIAKKLFER